MPVVNPTMNPQTNIGSNQSPQMMNNQPQGPVMNNVYQNNNQPQNNMGQPQNNMGQPQNNMGQQSNNMRQPQSNNLVQLPNQGLNLNSNPS